MSPATCLLRQTPTKAALIGLCVLFGVALAGATSALAESSPAGFTARVDFGTGSKSNTDPQRGKVWNNWNSDTKRSVFTVGSVLADLVDAGGTKTGVSLAISAFPNGNDGLGGAATKHDYEVPGFEDAAVRGINFWNLADIMPGSPLSTVVFTFAGLTPGGHYDIAVLATLQTTADRPAQSVAFNGEDPIVYEVVDNASAVEAEKVEADAEGRITMTLAAAEIAGGRNVVYLNALRIESSQ